MKKCILTSEFAWDEAKLLLRSDRQSSAGLLARPLPLILPHSAVLARHRLWLGTLDPELICRILRGEIDPAALENETLASLAREQHLEAQLRSTPVVSGWRPDNLSQQDSRLFVRAVPSPCRLGGAAIIDPRLIGRLIIPRLDVSAALPRGATSRRPAGRVALGALAAVLLVGLLVPSRHDDQHGPRVVDAAQAPWEAPTTLISSPVVQLKVAIHQLHDLAATPHNPLASYMKLASAPAPASVSTKAANEGSRSASVRKATANVSSAGDAVMSTRASGMSSAATLVTPPITEVKSPSHQRSAQLKRHAEQRWHYLPTAPRENAVLASLPEVLKPQ